MNAANYDALMLRELTAAQGERVLLHSCCAPCSSYCLQELAGYVRVTVLYYNPNLDCAQEYEKRKAEQLRFLRETGLADFLDCDYAPADFAAIAKGYEDAPEGGARCERCFALRLERTAREAQAGGFDWFATTLTVSPLKNAALINAIGGELARKYGVKWLHSDFKKRGGYQQSIALSKEHGLYRQNYCGCIYSKRERDI